MIFEDQPLVCICVPNYNNEKTIAKALDSIVNQTYQNIIIKIFDNASTDGGIKILKSYESKYPNIQVFQNETNIGGEANFTKCIQNMEGEYAAIYHADDVYSLTMIQEQVEFLQTHGDCGAVATHACTINNQSQIIGERFLPQEFKKTINYIFDNEIELLKITLKYGNIITCPSVMAKTEIYKNKIQHWNGTDYKTSADLDVWLRLAQFEKFGFITKPLMNYRVSESSYSYNLARIRTDIHDIFLVLNSYMAKNNIQIFLVEADKNNYDFLVFKDKLNRAINELIQGKSSVISLEIFSWNIARSSLRSKDYFLYYIVAILVVFIRLLPNLKIIQKMLYQVRHGR